MGSFYCSPSDPSEISVIISKLKKTSSDVNYIPVRILCKVSDILSEHISKLVNLSFTSGTFPNSLKIAQIIPIHKQGNKSDLGNYRPISILPTLSKIFERCMVSRILSYINNFKIITDKQFGFIKGKSTVDAILSFISFIHDSLNKKHHSISIFVDFRKAFDTVNHKILLSKLNYYGIRGISSDWFKSYLLDRKQYVKVGNHISHVETVNIGVPQGAVLAPLLFLLYINDLVNVSKLFQYVLFADDTTLCSSDGNFADLVSEVNLELENIKNWMFTNRLSLNSDKTYSVIFSNCDYNTVINPIIFNNRFVEIETNGKFLGVILDNKLTFKYHISFLCNKISKTVGILYKVKDYVPQHIMIQLYYSFVYPYIHYCNIVWSNTYHTHLTPLVTLQKKLIRIITNSDYLEHSNPLFKQTGILTTNQVHAYLLSIYMFKLSKSPAGLPTLDHNYATRHRDNVAPPFQRLTTGQHSVLHAGANIWNNLPNDIRTCNSIKIFKEAVKKFIAVNVL